MLARLWTGLAAVVAAGAFAPPAGAQVVATLTGERFQPTSGGATLQCGATPLDRATLSYDVAGVATGPYPGTFTERGTVTMEGGFVTTFQAEFTIESGTTTITGSKTLSPIAGESTGTCGPSIVSNEDAMVDVVERYTATIHQPGESFPDSGRSTTIMHAFEPATGPTSFTMTETFASGGPTGTTVDAEPAFAIVPVGTSHTVTATYRDALGRPIQGVTIIFTVTAGPQEGSTAQCTTNAAGQCSYSFLGPELPAAEEITACADQNVNGQVDPGEPCGIATVVFSAPATTPGTVRGGGQITDTIGGSRVTFALRADSPGAADPTKGRCNVIDVTTHTHINCENVTVLVVTPTHATLFGNAVQNGVPTSYRIDVDDLDNVGGADTFKIQTDAGYVAAGPVTQGNITIVP